jgi:hypothetical protein
MKEMKLNIQLFGHTNSTENYELPQFVGTDKPTWLGDINTAMSTIDTAVGTNASNITSLGTRVTSAEGIASQASTDVAGLTSTVNTLSGNVTTATTTANNAQSTATSALNTANTANGKADTNASAITSLDTRMNTAEANIENINLTTYSSSSVTRSTGTYDLNNQSLNYALNSDGSLAKIYGQVTASNVTSGGIATMSTPLRPENDIIISGGAISFKYTSSFNFEGASVATYTIKTDGTIEIPISAPTGGTHRIIFINSLIYVKDFGDKHVVGE